MIRQALLLCIGMLIVATACTRQQPVGQDDSGSTPRRQAAAEPGPDGRVPDRSLSQAAGEAQQAAAEALDASREPQPSQQPGPPAPTSRTPAQR